MRTSSWTDDVAGAYDVIHTGRLKMSSGGSHGLAQLSVKVSPGEAVRIHARWIRRGSRGSRFDRGSRVTLSLDQDGAAYSEYEEGPLFRTTHCLLSPTSEYELRASLRGLSDTIRRVCQETSEEASEDATNLEEWF